MILNAVMDDTDYEEDFVTGIEDHRRQISQVQMRRLEGYAAEIFATFGMDLLHTQSTGETPSRFVGALYGVTSGYDGDPKLLKVFRTERLGAPTNCLSHPGLSDSIVCCASPSARTGPVRVGGTTTVAVVISCSLEHETLRPGRRTQNII